jgi:hypothetical protein
MKKILFMLVLITGISISYAQEDIKNDLPEYTGDNFSLEGALALFKDAKSLEEFEKLINQENNNVNNLDLNNDGETDYIVVEDIQENDTHVIVLSTFLNEKEKQDIAIIGIEKTGKESAILQIEGDSELFAENTIVEPFEMDEKMEKSKGGPNAPEITPTSVVVNVWFWPSVRFIYTPGYKVWRSPFRWGYYPKWWKPWRPYRYSIFYGKCSYHRLHFKRTSTHRIVVARKIYTPKRSKSTLVVHNKRGTTVIQKNKKGKTTVIKSKRNSKRR